MENKNNEIIDTKERINVDVKDVYDEHPLKAKIKKARLLHKIERLIFDLEFFVILILYIILSLTVKSPFCAVVKNGWGFWWVLFLLLPIIPQLYMVIKFKKLGAFPIFFMVVFTYLMIGMVTNLWHPYWLLFFIVPIYHIIVSLVRTNKIRKAFESVEDNNNNNSNNNISNNNDNVIDN